MFLRQLQKIRQNSKSNKSISSVGSSSRSNRNSYLSDHTDGGDDSQSLRSVAGSQREFDPNNKSSVPQSFLNLFRTPSNSRSAHINANLASELDKYSLLNMTLSNNMISEKTSYNEDKQSRASTLGTHTTARASVHNLNHTKTDMVFDALSSIISQNHKINVGSGIDQRMSSKIQPPADALAAASNPIESDDEKQLLMDNIKLLVREAEKIRKRRIDKSIFICRALTLVVFIFICAFILFFIKTILFIWEESSFPMPLREGDPQQLLLTNEVISYNLSASSTSSSLFTNSTV